MRQLKCMVCGGTLIMNKGGESASCKNCGIEYPVEQMRQMLSVGEDGLEEHPQEYPKAEPKDVLWEEKKPQGKFLVKWGEYGLKAENGGMLDEKQVEFLHEIFSRYKKRQKGAKVWNRVLCSTLYSGKWVAPVSQGKVVYEVSGFTPDAMQSILTELQGAIPFECCFVAKGEEKTTEDAEEQPEVLDAIWTELEETTTNGNSGSSFEMLVDDVLSVFGQGVVVTGVIKCGTVQEGQRIGVVNKKTGERTEATVRTLTRYDPEDEQFHPVNGAAQDDGIQLFISGLSKKDLSVGDKLVAP